MIRPPKMTPLDEWAYRNILAGTSIEWLVYLVFAKLVSDLLAGLFGLGCLIALIRPFPGLRSRRKAVSAWLLSSCGSASGGGVRSRGALRERLRGCGMKALMSRLRRRHHHQLVPCCRSLFHIRFAACVTPCRETACPDPCPTQGTPDSTAVAARSAAVLYMVAFSASRWEPVCNACCQRLVADAKPHKVAFVAVMRNLVCLLTNASLSSLQNIPAPVWP